MQGKEPLHRFFDARHAVQAVLARRRFAGSTFGRPMLVMGGCETRAKISNAEMGKMRGGRGWERRQRPSLGVSLVLYSTTEATDSAVNVALDPERCFQTKWPPIVDFHPTEVQADWKPVNDQRMR